MWTKLSVIQKIVLKNKIFIMQTKIKKQTILIKLQWNVNIAKFAYLWYINKQNYYNNNMYNKPQPTTIRKKWKLQKKYKYWKFYEKNKTPQPRLYTSLEGELKLLLHSTPPRQQRWRWQHSF